jgi:hypothetical protein
VGTVLASPYARTRETAELAFGRDRVRVTGDLLNEAFPGTDDEDLARGLRRLLATRPPAGQNTVLVSHGFNLQGATGLSVEEGESAVFTPGDDAGRSSLVARITVEEWQTLAQQGSADRVGAGPARWRGPLGGRPPAARNGWWPGREGVHATSFQTDAGKPDCPRASLLGLQESGAGTPPGLTVVLSARSQSLLLRLYWSLVAAPG